MAAFFGDILDLPSRAVYSDSEEEEDEAGGDVPLRGEQAGDGVSFELRPANADLMAFSTVYVSMVKLDKPCTEFRGQLLAEVVDESCRKKLGPFARIYELEAGSVGWMAINVTHVARKSSSVVREIRSLLGKLLLTEKDKKPPILAIISVQPSPSGHVEYLSNGVVSTLPFSRLLLRHPMLPPMMVTSLLEATFLEVTTINRWPCCLFAFPDPRIVNFDVNQLQFPKEIVNHMDLCQKQLTAENNIYA